MKQVVIKLVSWQCSCFIKHIELLYMLYKAVVIDFFNLFSHKGGVGRNAPKWKHMSRNPKLFKAPPYAVEQRLSRLGGDLRTARLRRRLTMAEVAEKIGTGVRAVADAEKGKITTAAGVYVALLWAYDLMMPMELVADPAHDREGLRLAQSRELKRAHSAADKGLSNDF
jgi:transcriptional regulator with XRE-family HTH domain